MDRKIPNVSDRGFTLIELVIAMGIATFVMAGIVMAYGHQTRSGTNLSLVVATQQNLRASLHHLERDLRMLGADLKGRAYNTTVPILAAEADEIVFSWDDDKDGIIIPAEVIRYALYNSYSLGTQNLGRSEGGAKNQPVAQSIEAFDIQYFSENATLPMTRPVTGENRWDIRRIQLTLVARTRTPLKRCRVRGNTRFLNPQGDEVIAPQPDGFRRIMLTSHVALRNMGVVR